MISTTFRGESFYLLPYQAQWENSPVAKFTIQAQELTSLQGLQARRAYASKLVTTYNFDVVIQGAQLSDFTVAMQRLQNTRLLVPFWPAKQAASAATPPAFVSNAWLIAEQDLSQFEVNDTGTASTFTPSSAAFRVPIMIGFFVNDPSPAWQTSSLSVWSISFQESGDSAYALSPASADGVSSVTLPTGVTPKVFPFVPDTSLEIEAGNATVVIDRQFPGFTREYIETYYPQAASRSVKATFTQLTAASIAQLVYFFLKRQGTVEAFWVASPTDSCNLAAPTASSVVYVDRAAGLGDNRYVALIDTSTQATMVRHATAVDTAANTITLDAAPPSLRPGSARVASAILSRFDTAELSFTFLTDGIAQSEIRFVETASEYLAPASPEVIGTTVGALPRKAYLYRFTRNYPGGSIVDRFSGYESPVSVSGEVFAKTSQIVFSHSDIDDSLEVDKTKVQITAQAFSGNPLLLLMPNQLESPLMVEILECSPDDTGSAPIAKQRFYGKITAATFKGPSIQATAAHILSDLSRSVPRLFLQPTCGLRLFGPSCGLSEITFAWSGSCSQTGNTLRMTAPHNGAGVIIPGAGGFAYGRAWTGAGSSYQSRTIFNNTALTGGAMQFTLDRPFNPAPVGSVSVSMGCDKSVSACAGTLNNYGRFGGMPFVPNGNPSLVPVTQPASSGKK